MICLFIRRAYLSALACFNGARKNARVDAAQSPGRMRQLNERSQVAMHIVSAFWQ
jgi:hypothetical protein